MAQYVQPGFFSFSMPKWPPAKAEMIAPRPPNEYNSHYLQGTRRSDITTPIPRAGKILPGRRFDLIGPVAAKVSTVKPKDPDLYNRGPFDKLGRMKFESTIPAPIPTSTEYKFLPFKDNAEVNFGDKDDVPPVSIFSNMAPLELVERLIKGVSDPERKEAFEAVRKFLMRMELIKSTRSLTYAEESEYGRVVNGLRAKALDAFGDGSTIFASQLAFELGDQFGVPRGVPPGPAVPAIPGPAPIFVIPARPAPVPGPGISASSSAPASPISASSSAPASPIAASPIAASPIAARPMIALPDDAVIDRLKTAKVLSVIKLIIPPKDLSKYIDLVNDLNILIDDAKEERKIAGGVRKTTRDKLNKIDREIKDIAKELIKQYNAMSPVIAPSSAPASPSSIPSSAPPPPSSIPSSAPTSPSSIPSSTSSSTSSTSSLALTPVSTSTTPSTSSHPLMTPLIPVTSASPKYAVIPTSSSVPHGLAGIAAMMIPSTPSGTASATIPSPEEKHAKRSGVEVKMPPEVREMMAKDYINQPFITVTQKGNAQIVIDNRGVLSTEHVKSAFDSMHNAMKKHKKSASWQGPKYSKKDYLEAIATNLTHPSQLPKFAASGTATTTMPIVGSGRHSSFMDHPDLRRGMVGYTAVDSSLDLGWKPTAW